MDPPSYAETTFMSENFFGFPSTIKLEGAVVNSEKGDYAVYIRDSSACLVAKADVNILQGYVSFVNSSGQKFLVIKSATDQNNEQSFKVYHHSTLIGTGEVKQDQQFRLGNTHENRSYTVSSLVIGDIAVLRTKYAPPICNMHLPGSTSDSSTYAFDGVITFPDESVTKVEQCLCVALAIVFIMAQNHARIIAHSEGKCIGRFFGMMCVLVVILVFVSAWKALDYYGCESKKARGYLSYQGKEC